jgi:hypothetical protein
MNAVSRLSLRTKIIFCFLSVLCLGIVASVAVESLVAEPRIELTFSHCETNQNVRFAVIDIRNVGNAAAIYRGYSTNSPDCDVEYRTSSGEWSGRILRCFVPGDQILPPGGEIRARLYLQQDDVNWRVGFPYSKARFQDRLPPRIRSMLPYMRRSYTRIWTPEMHGQASIPPRAIACE